MLTMLHTLGPLWRLCTDFLYIARPGGTAGLQNRRVEFDPLALCRVGRWSSGKTPDCKFGNPRFDSGMTLHVVVSPTKGCRTAAYGLAGS